MLAICPCRLIHSNYTAPPASQLLSSTKPSDRTLHTKNSIMLSSYAGTSHRRPIHTSSFPQSQHPPKPHTYNHTQTQTQTPPHLAPPCSPSPRSLQARDRRRRPCRGASPRSRTPTRRDGRSGHDKAGDRAGLAGRVGGDEGGEEDAGGWGR